MEFTIKVSPELRVQIQHAETVTLEIPQLEITEREIKHIKKIIQGEVTVFNGWKVDDECESGICKTAAEKVAKYLTRIKP